MSAIMLAIVLVTLMLVPGLVTSFCIRGAKEETKARPAPSYKAAA